MPRLPMPSDTEGFSEETRAAVRHILKTRNGMPPPSSYLTYAGQAGALLSDLVDHLRYHTSLTPAETELAICTSARASNADYIWNGHVRLGRQAGTREEALHAVDTQGRPADLARGLRAGRPDGGRGAHHSLRAGAAGVTEGQRRHVQRRTGAVWRAGPAGADGRDERVHDERERPAGDGPPGGGGRAAFDAAVGPKTPHGSRTRRRRSSPRLARGAV